MSAVYSNLWACIIDSLRPHFKFVKTRCIVSASNHAEWVSTVKPNSRPRAGARDRRIGR